MKMRRTESLIYSECWEKESYEIQTLHVFEDAFFMDIQTLKYVYYLCIGRDPNVYWLAITITTCLITTT